jgi:hypothetical protein
MDARKPKVGDVAEIRTPEGLAYIQYTHDGKGNGELVRVLPGLYDSRPNLEALVLQRELYFIFYTLKYAMRDKQSEIVCNLLVPDWARPEPLMRHASGRTSEGKITGWRIMPALSPLTIDFLKRTSVIRELTQEQKRLSIYVLRPHPSMVKELARGWTPERAEGLEDQDRKEARARRAAQHFTPAADEAMSHYLYFPVQTDAECAGEQLRDRGYHVEVRKGADGDSWLALAKGARPKAKGEMDALRNEMEALAAQYRGEYDGWEAAIDSLAPESGEFGRAVN